MYRSMTQGKIESKDLFEEESTPKNREIIQIFILLIDSTVKLPKVIMS